MLPSTSTSNFSRETGNTLPDFPAFFTRKSGFYVDYCANTEGFIAEILRAKWAIPLQGGVVIANPVPLEFEANSELINEAIEKALLEADKQGMKGKAITPFLLSRIEQITEGASLKTNIQLVMNNAALAARIAQKIS